MTAPKLTDEMRQALALRPAGPIPIEDEELVPENFGSIEAIAAFVEAKVAARGAR